MQPSPKARRRQNKRPSRTRRGVASPFPTLLESYRGPVEQELRNRLLRETRKLMPLGASAQLLARSLLSLCTRGGKRIRPALLGAGALATGRELDLPTVITAGSALELLHGYLLVHDDWMDGDTLRRGGPSVHTALGRHFRDQKLGDAAAILVGDWGSAVATDWLLELALPPARLLKVLRIYATMHRAVVVGQQRDITGSDDIELTYLLKTASYSTTGPLVMGATMVGARAAELQSLRDFGTLVGIAFQHRDDLLGIFGQSKDTGKPLGSDLRSGKLTSLIPVARQHLKGAAKKTFEKAFGQQGATAAELRAATRVLRECGAPEVVEARITALLDQTEALLERSPFPREGRALLRSLAKTLVVRKA